VFIGGAFLCCLGLILVAVAILVAALFGVIVFYTSRFLTEKPRKRAIASWLVAIVTLLCVCSFACYAVYQRLPGERPSPRARPAEEDIVGVWAPNSSTLQHMQKEGGYEVSVHTLTFRHDGTFEMINMPDWWLVPWIVPAGKFHSGSGAWGISEFEGRWEISVAFTSLTGYENDLRKPVDLDSLHTTFYLARKEPPYLIYLYLGDPDEYKFIEFERQ
jgi:hypothetical protein